MSENRLVAMLIGNPDADTLASDRKVVSCNWVSSINTHLRIGDASRLPWPDATFDVWHSSPDSDLKQQIASDMMRVLKPRGIILLYDLRFNNPDNRKVRGIEAAEIRSLFAGCRISLEKTTLAPPIARAVVPLSWTATLLLEHIPLLRTHYLGVVGKST